MEKRAATRVLFNVKAELRYNDKSVNGSVINLSMHGMLFQSDIEIPEKTIVDADIYMEGTTSELKINAQGRVLRSDETGTAIAFKSMDIDSFIHLKNIVAYNEGDTEKIMKEFFNSIKQNKMNDV
ncbi:MAG: PilZ domain-containing protein [Spirochaetes bacterium]|jgi:hypothetical protein|nr:PilZ domain-containing protein [Spirochaetota bacterium]